MSTGITNGSRIAAAVSGWHLVICGPGSPQPTPRNCGIAWQTSSTNGDRDRVALWDIGIRSAIRGRLIAFLSVYAMMLAVFHVGANIGLAGSYVPIPTWNASSYAAGAPNTTYTFSFTSASDLSITGITYTLSNGNVGGPVLRWTGSPSLTSASGVPVGSVSISGSTITYALEPPYPIVEGVRISIRIRGLVNPISGSYSLEIDTESATGSIHDMGAPTLTSFNQ